MALLMYFVLFLALAGHSSALYCVCKDGVGDQALQKAIDYACGAGADCTPILQNGACFQPNTVKDHCNYAVNSYSRERVKLREAVIFLVLPPLVKLHLLQHLHVFTPQVLAMLEQAPQQPQQPLHQQQAHHPPP
uniref:X8 domain-containing protein n=1 Tax=Glycine max TaxID=3847 RepID=C6TEI8_SOYBN|nr:unknown [Glycine max]